RFDTALDSLVDIIQDFESGTDQIELNDAFFSALGPLGELSPSSFASNTAGLAGDADDRIVYNSSNGRLMYDADGSDTMYAAIHFATLTGAPLIQSTDLYVV